MPISSFILFIDQSKYFVSSVHATFSLCNWYGFGRERPLGIKIELKLVWMWLAR